MGQKANAATIRRLARKFRVSRWLACHSVAISDPDMNGSPPRRLNPITPSGSRVSLLLMVDSAIERPLFATSRTTARGRLPPAPQNPSTAAF